MKRIFCTGALFTDIITGNIPGEVKQESGFLTEIGIFAGGNAFNVSAGLVKLGVPGENVCCCGALGNDSASFIIRKEAEKLGIARKFYEIEGINTAKSVIIQFEGGKRGFIVDKGANILLSPNEIQSAMLEFSPQVFYIGETSTLDRSGQSLPGILKNAKDNKCMTVVDYVVIGESDPAPLISSAKHIDFLHCNDYEAEAITGRKDVIKAVKFFLEKGFRAAAVTRGEKDIICAFNGKIFSTGVFSVKCEDATGAGDAFTAGIIKKMSEQDDDAVSEEEFIEMIIYAQAAGAACVMRKGCVSGVSAEITGEIIREQYGKIRKSVSIL